MLTNGYDDQLEKESYNEKLNKWQIPKTIMQSNDQPGHKATTTTNYTEKLKEKKTKHFRKKIHTKAHFDEPKKK